METHIFYLLKYEVQHQVQVQEIMSSHAEINTKEKEIKLE